MRLIVAAALAAPAALAVGADAARADPGAGTTVVVTITRGGVEVAPVNVLAGTLRFKVSNHGRVARDFAIGGTRTARIAPGRSATLLVALTPGFRTYSSMRSGRRDRITGLLDVLTPCTDPVATTVTVDMTQEPGRITPSQKSIACGAVTFVVTNVGALTDELWVFGSLSAEKGVTPEIAPGQTANLTIQFAAKGIVYYESGIFPPAEPEYGGDAGEQGVLTIT